MNNLNLDVFTKALDQLRPLISHPITPYKLDVVESSLLDKGRVYEDRVNGRLYVGCMYKFIFSNIFTDSISLDDKAKWAIEVAKTFKKEKAMQSVDAIGQAWLDKYEASYIHKAGMFISSYQSSYLNKYGEMIDEIPVHDKKRRFQLIEDGKVVVDNYEEYPK